MPELAHEISKRMGHGPSRLHPARTHPRCRSRPKGGARLLPRWGTDLPCHVQHVALTALAQGCANVTVDSAGHSLPDCAVADVLPHCAPKALQLTHGCTCAQDGNLAAANCPDAGM
jgi:hypothetical protein